ncbi:MAG TPA: competence type IV pilus major pilin ComGC [Pseudogracilibacillus sp.]|nr:competence type IV pilus major pilin ComGC [Pseudogracilibacillus sp.]
MKSLKGQKGFTLIEMLIVMLVITILLLLIIPNITKQSSSLREKGCDALIKTVQTQVEAYQLDHGEKPSSLNTLLSEGYINDDQLTCEGGIEIVYSDETGEVSKGS